MGMAGDELRKHRRQLNLTQKEMANVVGVHKNSLARMERDEMTISEPVARFIRLLVATRTRTQRRRH